MPNDVTDLRSTIVPRSDQLNAEQLLAGPMILTVSDVRAGGGEDQPVSIYYADDPSRPYKPCKTMRKVLILAWGPDGTQWIGKSMELFNEPSVKFGGEVVGGIRISRLSDIPKAIKVSLTATKGRKSLHEIGPLEASAALTEVLAAITAATGRDSLKTARTKAEALTDARDLALARAAYAKKVEQLKAQAAPTTETGADPVTKAAALSALGDAKTPEALEAARKLVARVEDAVEQAELNAFATKRYAAISKGE